MKINTEINKKEKIRIHRISGIFDFSILYRALKDIYNDPGFNPELNSVWDFRNVSGIKKISYDQISMVITYISKKRRKKIKTAIVVPSDLDFVLARMNEQQLEMVTNDEVRVFKDFKKSLTWLNS
jgi:hypothetical protein